MKCIEQRLKLMVIAGVFTLLSGCVSHAPEVTELGDEKLSEAKNDPKTAVAVSATLSKRQQLLLSPNAYQQSNRERPDINSAIRTAISSALQAKLDGYISAARVSFTTLAIENPSLSSLPVHLGDIAIQGNNLPLAKQYYQQALIINKHNYYAANRLGTLQRQAGEFEQAQLSYRQAMNSWPGFAPAHRNLAILLDLYIGDKSQALQYYQSYWLLVEPELDKAEKRQVNAWIFDLQSQLKISE